jgi:hypothetical protein
MARQFRDRSILVRPRSSARILVSCATLQKGRVEKSRVGKKKEAEGREENGEGDGEEGEQDDRVSREKKVFKKDRVEKGPVEEFSVEEGPVGEVRVEQGRVEKGRVEKGPVGKQTGSFFGRGGNKKAVDGVEGKVRVEEEEQENGLRTRKRWEVRDAAERERVVLNPPQRALIRWIPPLVDCLRGLPSQVHPLYHLLEMQMLTIPKSRTHSISMASHRRTISISISLRPLRTRCSKLLATIWVFQLRVDQSTIDESWIAASTGLLWRTGWRSLESESVWN